MPPRRVKRRVKTLWTAQQAAAYYQIDIRTLYRLLKTGEIPGQKVGGHWRFDRAELDHWWKARVNGTSHD